MKKAVAVLLPYMETAASGEKAEGSGKILLATVKGDVHDIGKNIVGVVLGCNGYEVIDLGVMVPADKILDTAEKERVDIVGLSGLITPSLDEMVHVAHEMKRRGMKQPLLIGGATTSRMHTAVKIAPQYDNGVVHVLDASRSVNVATTLLSADQKKNFLKSVSDEYITLASDFSKKKTSKQYISLAEAQKNGARIDWSNYNPPHPSFTGTRIFDDVTPGMLRDYIDWGPFFIAWEMGGRFPDLLRDEKIGAEATKLFNDANELLQRIIDENWLQPKGVIGFWPCTKTSPDSIRVGAAGKDINLEFLRQQVKKAEGQPNLSLADFIKPGPTRMVDDELQVPLVNENLGENFDYIGAFSVTIRGIEPHLKKFAEQHDDYNKIMLQALADRLAEAFAEYLHELVRKQIWGYAKDEHLTNEELIKERYTGIRPAPGYPACPDHTEKHKLFHLLGGEESTGIHLTESLAMYPAASVCGWYFSHPQSQYFGVGKIQRDQFEDYTKRKGMSELEMEKWLRPVLD